MIKGNKIFVLVNGAVVALCTNCSLVLSANLMETASASGEWKDYICTKTDWSVNSDHLLAFDNINISPGDQITLSFGETRNGQLSLSGYRYVGNAIMASSNIEANKGSNVHASIKFVGVGDIRGFNKEVYFITKEGKALTTSDNRYFISND